MTQDTATTLIRSVPDNLSWGLFDPARPPVATLASGDSVILECLPSWLPDLAVPPEVALLDDHRIAVQRVARGPGPHFVTGPVAVQGAEPGDVLQLNGKIYVADTNHNRIAVVDEKAASATTLALKQAGAAPAPVKKAKKKAK